MHKWMTFGDRSSSHSALTRYVATTELGVALALKPSICTGQRVMTTASPSGSWQPHDLVTASEHTDWACHIIPEGMATGSLRGPEATPTRTFGYFASHCCNARRSTWLNVFFNQWTCSSGVACMNSRKCVATSAVLEPVDNSGAPPSLSSGIISIGACTIRCADEKARLNRRRV
jgi:hypothetical protein